MTAFQHKIAKLVTLAFLVELLEVDVADVVEVFAFKVDFTEDFVPDSSDAEKT